MYIVILIIVAMLSSVLTLFFHCCVILGKESDRKWEEEQITKKEGKEELKDTNVISVFESSLTRTIGIKKPAGCRRDGASPGTDPSGDPVSGGRGAIEKLY